MQFIPSLFGISAKAGTTDAELYHEVGGPHVVARRLGMWNQDVDRFKLKYKQQYLNDDGGRRWYLYTLMTQFTQTCEQAGELFLPKSMFTYMPLVYTVRCAECQPRGFGWHALSNDLVLLNEKGRVCNTPVLDFFLSVALPKRVRPLKEHFFLKPCFPKGGITLKGPFVVRHEPYTIVVKGYNMMTIAAGNVVYS